MLLSFRGASETGWVVVGRCWRRSQQGHRAGTRDAPSHLPATHLSAVAAVSCCCCCCCCCRCCATASPEEVDAPQESDWQAESRRRTGPPKTAASSSSPSCCCPHCWHLDQPTNCFCCLCCRGGGGVWGGGQPAGSCCSGSSSSRGGSRFGWLRGEGVLVQGQCPDWWGEGPAAAWRQQSGAPGCSAPGRPSRRRPARIS